MGKIGQSALTFMGLGLILAACSGSSKTSPPDRAAAGGDGSAESICSAGARRCDGLNVKICSDDGSTETIDHTCLPTQTCSDGVCTENACLPNTRFCKSGAIWKCDSVGGGSALAQSCAAGQFCRDDDGSVSCSSQACTPGQAMCDTNIATTCAMDGSGPQPGGTDCAATKQACYQGQCRDVACAGGMKQCLHDDVYLCAQNGTDVSLFEDCQATEVCDADMGACRPKVCDVGKPGCNGTRAVKCNAFGSDWLAGGKDCAADGSVCVSGDCKKQICKPGSSFCQDGAVYQCDSAGATSSLSQTCQPGSYHCQAYPGNNYAACVFNQCTPDQLLCDGNVARTCNADGSWPATGTDCGSDKYCDNGACKPTVCEPYTAYCQDGDIWWCDFNGGPQQGSQQPCPAETTCKAIGSLASCAPLPCVPGNGACIANKGGTCAPDGQSLVSVAQDCGAGGNVCDVDGKCAATVTDTLGIAEDAETEFGGAVIGDVIDVSSARKLTELQMNLVLASPRELRWVIYEQVGANFVARVDKVNSNQSGTGFFSSGAGGLTYTLKAGKRYLLAVAIAGGNSSIAYFDGAPFSLNASFGNIAGFLNTSYSATLDAGFAAPDRVYQMKVTTELP